MLRDQHLLQIKKLFTSYFEKQNKLISFKN